MNNAKEILPEAEIRRLADMYRLRLDPISSSGTFGSRAGRETGASVEVQDFRNYTPGDDPRRIDWFSYGRTGDLIVRLYREEISPFVDIIVDTSASMSVADGRKGPLSHELCRWLFKASAGAGSVARLFAAGRRITRLHSPEEIDFCDPESVLFTAPKHALAGLRRSSIRVVLSDFMNENGPAATISALAEGCAMLVVVHILGPWEANPAAEGPARLKNIESTVFADLTIDSKAVKVYQSRLSALKEEVRRRTSVFGGISMTVVADCELEKILRTEWLPMGLVEAG